jgi:methyl-accepting chemotaxis protein
MKRGDENLTVHVLREIRDEIVGLREDQRAMREDQHAMREDQRAMREEIHGMRHDLNGRLDQTNSRLDQTNSRLEMLVEDVSQFRHETARHFDTILKVSGEHYRELRERVGVLETRVDRLAPR